ALTQSTEAASRRLKKNKNVMVPESWISRNVKEQKENQKGMDSKPGNGPDKCQTTDFLDDQAQETIKSLTGSYVVCDHETLPDVGVCLVGVNYPDTNPHILNNPDYELCEATYQAQGETIITI
ncbi:hypothetical protein TrLO_g6869, partial [Triparma laevis f. longispina]